MLTNTGQVNHGMDLRSNTHRSKLPTWQMLLQTQNTSFQSRLNSLGARDQYQRLQAARRADGDFLWWGKSSKYLILSQGSGHTRTHRVTAALLTHSNTYQPVALTTLLPVTPELIFSLLFCTSYQLPQNKVKWGVSQMPIKGTNIFKVTQPHTHTHTPHTFYFLLLRADRPFSS